MRITRDSIGVVVTFLAAVSMFLATRFELVQAAFPGLTPEWKSRIELVAALLAFISGLGVMSPLPLSRGNPHAVEPNKKLTPLSRMDTPSEVDQANKDAEGGQS